MRHLHTVSQFLVALWLGALLGFILLVAPALFAAYAPDGAAKAVRLLLPKLDALTLAIAALAAGLSLRLPKKRARMAVLVLTFVAALVSLVLVTPRMAELRAQANDQMSALAKDTPIRREFGRLHGVSSSLMLLEVLLLGAAYVLGARATLTDRSDPSRPR